MRVSLEVWSARVETRVGQQWTLRQADKWRGPSKEQKMERAVSPPPRRRPNN